MTTSKKSTLDECVEMLENITTEELISLLPDEKSKRIGYYIHTKGYQEAMEFCTKKVGDMKI